MFIALVIKEWREKALIFLFELAVLAGLLGAQHLVRANRDLREWFIFAILLLFFPFAALILGTSGFETEFRQGAWAYLFSRPLSRAMVWWAKFAALLGLVAALWLVFLAVWAVLPAIRVTAVWPSAFINELAAVKFPWWSLGLSSFMFIVAFTLAFLNERYFNLLFVSLTFGLALPTAGWSLYYGRAGRFLAWISEEKAFRTLIVGLALMALAFIGASLLTLVRADFSQPRKRIGSFARWFVPLLLAGQAFTVATAFWVPVPGEHFLYPMGSTDQVAVYSTERGLFVYDASSVKIHWLEKNRRNLFELNSISSRRIAYVSYEYVSRNDLREEVWFSDSDGQSRTRVLGPDTPGPWPKDASIRGLLISPDGRQLAVLAKEFRRSPGNRISERCTLWTVNVDGSGLEQWPLDGFGLSDNRDFSLDGLGISGNRDLSLVAWGKEPNVLVISRRYRYPSKPVGQSLWLYDLDRRTVAEVYDDAGQASWRTPLSPRGDLLAVRYPYGSPTGPRTLALLDLKTQAKSVIVEDTRLMMSGFQWDPTGKLVSYILVKTEEGGTASFIVAVYALSEKKVVSEKVITSSKRWAAYLSSAWMPDGRSLVVADGDGRNLLFLGSDLQETGRVPLPAWITGPRGIAVLGRQLLIADGGTGSLWRLDLESKRWKRIY
jgi:hypothetical protein